MEKNVRSRSRISTVFRTSVAKKKSIIIERPIYSHNVFDSCQVLGERGTPLTPWQKLERWTVLTLNAVKSWHPNLHWILVHCFITLFPISSWLPRYKIRSYLPKDLITGFTVGIMNIPQGMAYALLAQVPAVFGLYTSFYPTLIYTVMCTSRHVSFGTFAIVSIMTGNVISSRLTPIGIVTNSTANVLETTVAIDDVNENVETRVTIMIAVTVAVGIWQLLLGALGMGNLSVYLSDQLVKGFTTGAAFHVFTSQVKSILGLRNMTQYSGPLKLVYTYIDLFEKLPSTHLPTLAISASCITTLLAIKYLFNENHHVQLRLPIKIPLPGELVVVMFGTLTSYLMDLSGSNYNISVVGRIPLGMPAPLAVDFTVLPKVMMDSFGIAIVSFAITVSLAKLYANKFEYSIDPNQELRAMGCSNFISGFFQCIPATGSLGRTAVQTSMGGATQIVSVISCCMVLIVILVLGFLLEPLPKACLASIIVVSLIGLLKQVTEVQRLWKVSIVDTSVFLVSLIGVIFLDVDSGLGLAVGWNLLTVVFRTQRPDVAVLGRAMHTDIYKCIRSYKTTEEIDGCKILRFEAPLYFANSEYFIERAKELSGIRLRQKLKRKQEKERKRNDDSQSSTNSTVTAAYDNFAMNANLNTVSSQASGETEAENQVPRTSTSPTPSNVVCAVSITHLIIDCSSISFVDINGINAMKDLARQCADMGIILFLATCKADLREFLALSGYSEELQLDRIFVTVHDAVMQAVKTRRIAAAL